MTVLVCPTPSTCAFSRNSGHRNPTSSVSRLIPVLQVSLAVSKGACSVREDLALLMKR